MKVRLLTNTKKMAENLWLIWQLSRSPKPIEALLPNYDAKKVEKFFARIINEEIPLAEMIDFIFLLEDIPISLREQLVRHRVGVKVAGQHYVDAVFDFADSSFWSQSMRVLDMSKFATEEKYFVPESIKENIPVVSHQKVPLALYQEAMLTCGRVYATLVDAGIPREDARNVIPLGATHRIVWKLNLSALKHIVGKRSCWILQLGLWKPIIQGMIDELCRETSIFRQLASPPCMKDDVFLGCKFRENNKSRIVGDVDRLPPCSLYLHYHYEEAKKTAKPAETVWWTLDRHGREWVAKSKADEELMDQMRIEYSDFWHRNIDTGKMLV